MSRYLSYITHAEIIITSLKKAEPLVHHLKKYFATNKKFGATDRRVIANLCYQYYRLGQAMHTHTIQQKIIGAHFLCTQLPSSFLAAVAPHFNEQVQHSILQKCALLQITPAQLFIWQHALSPMVNADAFALFMLIQPQFFVRLRGNNTNLALALATAGVPYSQINATCIALPQATKLQQYADINKNVVVQDYNSQQVFNYCITNKIAITPSPTVWDCCAASGGKSILLHDLFDGKINLTVSDVRPTILDNLRLRFSQAGIQNYTSMVADLTKPATTIPSLTYDIIVCDVPCTGSGTWSRTPEQLAFFDGNSLVNFAEQQKKIVSRVLPHLKKNGLLFYITCSAFKQENEDVVNNLATKYGLKILHLKYLLGYYIQADTMFVAVLSF